MTRLSALLFLGLFSALQAWAASPDDGATGERSQEGADRIPDVFVALPSGGRPAHAILVEKSTQQLTAYAFDGSYRQIFRCKSSTGEASGPKRLAGDRKTPEGVYLFTKMHEKRDLSATYGNRAYPTDYPNVVDRLAGRTGNAIWMHGTNKPLRERDSNGCIVLENADIDELALHITLNRTPIIIVDTVNYTPRTAAEAPKQAILAFLRDWTNALAAGTYHQYLGFYDSEYLPSIAWWTTWQGVRRTFASSPRQIRIGTDNVSIARFSGEFVVWFDEVARSDGLHVYSGTRKLFLTPVGDRLRIAGEEYSGPSQEKRADGLEHPIVAASRQLKRLLVERRDIPDLIDRWLKAWSSKDIKAYGGCYARGFRSQGGDGLGAWLAYKERLNQRYKAIEVSIDGLVVEKGTDRRAASFMQTYNSTGFQSVCRKRLIFVREEGQWKIYRETSEEI